MALSLKLMKEAHRVFMEAETKKGLTGKFEGTLQSLTEVYGSLSDKLLLKAELRDKEIEDPSPHKGNIVGYRFKTLVDLDIPDVPLGTDVRENHMSYEGDPLKTRLVKAGEIFDLTLFETGMLLSRCEFNTRCMYENYEMQLNYEGSPNTLTLPMVLLNFVNKDVNVLIPQLHVLEKDTNGNWVLNRESVGKFDRLQDPTKQYQVKRVKAAEAFLNLVSNKKG